MAKSGGFLSAVREWLERRSHPSNPDRWFIRHLGAEPSVAGVEVTEENALSATAVHAGVQIISSALAMLPLKVYERTGERTKALARQMILYRLLHDEPNPEQTSFEFREMQMGFLLLWGNCYAQKMYNGRGEVVELWPLTPWRVTPERTAADTLVYRVTLPDGGETTLPADDVLHIRGFTSNGLLGDNLVQRFRDSIGLSLAAEKYGGAFFGNGANAGGFLSHPQKLGPEARKNLRESFGRENGGISNAHRVGILEEGMTWIQRTVNPEDAQALETRKFQVTEVARILNLPPHLLKDLERATFTNIEHQGQEFVTYTMQPWLTRWEQRLNKSLLLPSQRSRFFTKFEVEGLLRGDSAARSAFYTSMFGIGAYSVNDIREKEDDEPVEGGDQRFVPLNMVPLDRAAELAEAGVKAKAAPAPAPAGEEEPRAIRPEPRAALEPVFRAEADRVVTRQAKAVRGALKKDAQNFRAWLDEFAEKESQHTERALGPAFLSLAVLTGERADARAFALLDTENAVAEIRKVLRDAPEEFEGRVESIVATWEEERAESLVRLAMERPALSRAA